MEKKDNLFSIGEVAKYQNISKQTLIFYDKAGVFRPAWVDPANGYRYYSASQLDYLDTILIMKQIGFSLQEIKDHMQHYDLDSSLAMLRRQLDVIDQKVAGLKQVRRRVQNRCDQMEAARTHCAPGQPGIELEDAPEQELFCLPVEAPYTMQEISIATKQCFARAAAEACRCFISAGWWCRWKRSAPGGTPRRLWPSCRWSGRGRKAVSGGCRRGGRPASTMWATTSR